MFTDNPKNKLRCTFNFSVASHKLSTWNFGIQTAEEEEIEVATSVTTSFLQQVQEKGPALSKGQINQFLVYVKKEPGIPLQIT